MPRLARIAFLAAGGALALLVAVFALAYALMPRDWIEREAKRRASEMSGAAVTWDRLEPGFANWSLGVRIRGLAVRAPAKGDARVQARLDELFVRFKLLPLLTRRVEVDAARIDGGGIALTDPGTPDDAPPPSAPSAQAAGGVALVLPRIEVKGVDLRTRDALGGGFDLRRISGRTDVAGPLSALSSAKIAVSAESLFWKPSAREAPVALPAPLDVAVTLAGKEGGERLEVTEGRALLGPLVSAIRGVILLPAAPGTPSVAIVIAGGPQAVRSNDPAIRAIAARSPATWSAIASWEIRIDGPLTAPVQTGRVTVKPLSITAQSNVFAMDRATVTWTGRADRTFTARTEAHGGGITMTGDANGATTPGGAVEGSFFLRAPAQRLNGLAPNTPAWSSGDLECSGRFALRPPAEPQITWTARGRSLSGSVPGVARPVRRLAFDVEGTPSAVTVKTLDAVVGSTTASIKGRVAAGKPLGTGSFTVAMDRLVAEEWTPAGGAGPAAGPAAAAPAAGGAPPIPLKAFDAKITIGTLRSGGLTVRDVVVPARYEDGTLTAPIRGAIGGGSLDGALDMQGLLGKTPAFTLHMDVKRAPVEELASGLLPIKVGLSGLVSGVIDLAGPGFPGPEVADSLRGAAAGTVENGSFRQGPVLRELRNTLGLESAPEVAFRTLTHSLRIAGGKMLLDKVAGELGKDRFEMVGSMGFDQSLNLDLLLRLAPERLKGGGAAAEFARLARDADGRIPVAIKITGSALAPRISVKASRTLEGVGSALKQELIQGLAERTRAGTAADSGAAPTDSAKRDALEKGRDALKRLLGK